MALRRTLARTLSVVAAAALLAPLLSAPASAAPPGTTTGLYVALGDSVPAGSATGGFSYVDVLAERLATGRSPLEALDLSVGGARTDTMSAQVAAAVAAITERRLTSNVGDDVRLITLTIGGNDVFRPVTTACDNPEAPGCAGAVGQALLGFAVRYPQIVGALRQAAGPSATVALMTYYNSIQPPCRVAPLNALAQEVLEGGTRVPTGLNDIIRATAAVFGAVVVETEHVIGSKQLVGDCLHPTAAGQKAIGNQFYAQVARYVRPPA